MTTRPDPDRRLARFARLPIIAGPIVLAGCWTVLAIVANAQHAACWGGFNLTNIAGPLSLDLRFYGNVSPLWPLLAYAVLAYSPYLLLYAAGLFALRLRALTALFAISVGGTSIVSLSFGVGYAATYPDVAGGGFLCDLGFELIPFFGLIVAVFAIVLGSFIGWLVRRRTSEGAMQ